RGRDDAVLHHGACRASAARCAAARHLRQHLADVAVHGRTRLGRPRPRARFSATDRMKTMTPGFSLTSLRIGGGLLVWALHFSAVYIVTALMCARDAADAQWLGLPALPLVIAALTLIAIVALGALARQALRGR